MNKLMCFLSGGHKYYSSRVSTARDYRNHTIVIMNPCAKCSKVIALEVPESFIDKEIEKAKLHEWLRWHRDET